MRQGRHTLRSMILFTPYDSEMPTYKVKLFLCHLSNFVSDTCPNVDVLRNLQEFFITFG